MAQIYKITNRINNKVYIGKTEICYIKRFNEHCREYAKDRNEKRPLYNAMKKYGIENFNVELLIETDTPEQDEIRLIKEYNSYISGYNATLGGDGKKYLDLDVDSIIDEYVNGALEYVKEIAIKYNVHPDTITSLLKNKGVEIKHPKELDKKPVGRFDKDTNQLLECYDCSHNAGKSLGKVNGSHINSCALGKRKTAYGFIWKFI